ncbi:MAG: glycosyltransferase family 4 protein [bacterium]|nr:glycosyltransferase family 4 protein [bacterium]
MPARVVIDCRRIKDFGVGTYIRNLTRELARLDKATEYTLVAQKEDHPEFRGFPPNFKPVHYPRPDSEQLDNVRFPHFLRSFRADLHHLPSHRVPLLMRKPYVVTVHDLSSLLYEKREGWRRQLRLSRVQHGLKRAAKVVAVSAATRRDVINLLGIPAGHIRQIYNAPDPRFIEQPTSGDPDSSSRYRQRILERYQIQYPFILYVGNIRPQKNVPRLVESFAVLRGQLTDHPLYKDLRLIIIGDESARVPSVRIAVMQSRVDKVVRFLGFVPIDTLRVFYEAASAFAFPSLYEGFGLPPLEAMAAGTPVVSSGVSSLPEVVGDAAVIVNPENVFDIARGLRDALLDEELRASLIARGYDQSKRFSWERTAAEVLDTYRELVPRVGVS